jgi:hypothetical protein
MFINKFVSLLLLAVLSGSVFAKLPAPSDEAKAKALEAAAKTAWTGKVDGYLLCKSQNKVAVSYYKTAKATGKDTKPAATSPPCADPGAFVYPLPVVAVAASLPAAKAPDAAVKSATPAAKKS